MGCGNVISSKITAFLPCFETLLHTHYIIQDFSFLSIHTRISSNTASGPGCLNVVPRFARRYEKVFRMGRCVFLSLSAFSWCATASLFEGARFPITRLYLSVCACLLLTLLIPAYILKRNDKPSRDKTGVGQRRVKMTGGCAYV